MGISEETGFVRQVRDAVAHLYDYAYLQRHPLAAHLVQPEAAAAHTRGRELRRILLDAIEALNPGMSVPIRAPERRPYAILFGLYVEGRPLQEVASSLGIVGRQLRRGRAAAFEALAALLRDRYLTPGTSGSPAAGAEPLRQESERLAQGREPVDLHQLVHGLLPLLEKMARERGVSVRNRVPPGLPPLYANRTLVRQVLIGLASQALKSLPLLRLSFEKCAVRDAAGVGLRLRYRAVDTPAEGSPVASSALHLGPVDTLAAALGATLEWECVAEGEEIVWLLIPQQEEAVVLVVDDNQELFALFERYAARRPYRLVHAGGADQALALARSLQPQIITIDLMMPKRDGWELLQALRSDPAMAHTPVIVCSVLEEPELALSLGADSYLKKPVGQGDLLAALEAAKGRVWAGAGRREAPADS